MGIKIMDFNEVERIEINTKKHLVAFLDILGFKNYVTKCLDKKDFKELNKSGNLLKNKMINLKKVAKLTNVEIKYNQFSDSICIAIPYSEGDNLSFTNAFVLLILILKTYQMELLEDNFYIRGAISTGFHLEFQEIVFSEGLIKAYELESKKAIYPRVILDYNVQKAVKYIFKNDEKLKNAMSCFGVKKMILSDWDNIIFLNPFSWNSTKINSKGLEKAMKSGINQYFNALNLKMPPELEDINLNNSFEELQNYSLSFAKNIKNTIEELENKNKDDRNRYHILQKYLWLQELVKWNIDPKSAKINFKYFLK